MIKKPYTIKSDNKMMKDGWKQCPSVTPGGKSHFWHKRENNINKWVVWNRQKDFWEYQEE